MGGDVAQDERTTVTDRLEQRDRLTIMAGRKDEHAGMGVELGQSIAGLMAEHDDTSRFLRSLGNIAGIGSAVVGRSGNGKLPAPSIGAAECIDQVALALLLIDAGD